MLKTVPVHAIISRWLLVKAFTNWTERGKSLTNTIWRTQDDLAWQFRQCLSSSGSMITRQKTGTDEKEEWIRRRRVQTEIKGSNYAKSVASLHNCVLFFYTFYFFLMCLSSVLLGSQCTCRRHKMFKLLHVIVLVGHFALVSTLSLFFLVSE